MSAYAKSLRAGHGYGFSSTSGRMLIEAEIIGKAVHKTINYSTEAFRKLTGTIIYGMQVNTKI